jgi:NAD(P)-dependent dehydrogenase (short-subunit alcohol dehydrogenase family)
VNTPLTDSGAPRGAVVITGASTGIGRACALSLDALGFRVFAGVRKSADGESLRRASSAHLTPIFIDVTDEQSIAAAAEEVSREVGDAGLAGLVNNAGVAIPGPLEYLPLEELR